VPGLSRAAWLLFHLGDLWRQPRIDAGRAEEQELAHADLGSGVDQVRLQREIVVTKIGRAAGVGVDAADARGGEDHRVRLGRAHPRLHVSLAAHVDLAALHGKDFAVLAGEPAHHRRAHHAAMAGDPDAAPSDSER
jgi:hypothetical protein